MKTYYSNISEAQFSLIICGQDLNNEDITNHLALEPTRTFKQGDLLNRLPEVVAQEDAWFHTIQLSQPEGYDPALLGMLGTIKDAKEYLNTLRENGTRVILRLSVNSDNAYMGYCLMPATLAALNEIGFPLDVQTVSWGEITF